MATLYVNKPGGVIVHLADGAQRTLGYGSVVPVSELADHQKDLVKSFADPERKAVNPEQDHANDQVRQAHLRAVMGDVGQVNSSAGPVPGDYDALDEDGAIGLFRALEAYPEAQAQLVIYERLHGGRERVLDAASPVAKASADAQLDQVAEQVEATHGPATDPGDGGDGDDSKSSRSRSTRKAAAKPTPPPAS